MISRPFLVYGDPNFCAFRPLRRLRKLTVKLINFINVYIYKLTFPNRYLTNFRRGIAWCYSQRSPFSHGYHVRQPNIPYRPITVIHTVHSCRGAFPTTRGVNVVESTRDLRGRVGDHPLQLPQGRKICRLSEFFRRNRSCTKHVTAKNPAHVGLARRTVEKPYR